MSIKRISERQHRQAYHGVFLQMIVTLVAALIIWPFAGWQVAYAIVVGGLVSIIPSWYFAWKFFSVTGALAAKKIALTMYRAEIGKLLLTGLLFVVVFTFLSIAVAPFFGGFVLAQITGLCTPLFIKNRVVS